MSDQLWPSTFSTEERKSIRNYVSDYINEHGLTTERDVTEQEQLNAISEMQHDEDFPVPMGQSAAIIQAAFLEARGFDAKRSRSKSQVKQTPGVATTRTPSSVKRTHKRVVLDSEDSGSGDDNQDQPVMRGRKRLRRHNSAARDVSEADDDDDEMLMNCQSPEHARRSRSSKRAVLSIEDEE
jgi:hypothetical protein